MAKQRGKDHSRGEPGSSHKDATKPGGDQQHGPEPRQRRSPGRSRVSGGGGERDKHHTHNPRTKS
jgi:hypothetical protein